MEPTCRQFGRAGSGVTMNFFLLFCVFALDLTSTAAFTVRRSSLDTVYDVGGGQPMRDIPDINAGSGKRLFEGDIVLPRERNAVTDRSKRWKFPIPYILADNLDLNSKGVIVQAFEMFRLKSCVDFKPHEGEQTYIKFEKLDGCWSYVGDLQKGQSLSIGERCDYKSIVEHELLHALGFYHEHSRTDRDDYVKIWWDEIIEGYAYAFDKYDDDFISDLNTPYDYDSVMHYGPLSFNKNYNVATITTKIPAFNDIIGQRLDLSKIDLERLNRMYNCTSTLAMLDQCSFEFSNICGMVRMVQDGAEWTHTISKPGEEDHTLVGGCRDGGYYMYLDTKSGKQGQSGLLESRILYPQRSKKCLQFFYKMNGSPQDQIIVWIRKDDGTGNVRRLLKLKSINGQNNTLFWDKPSITGTFDTSCNCFRGPDIGWVTFVSHNEIQRKNFLKNDDFFLFADFEDLTPLIKTEV
ncbi:meprin A subunit alpha-like isoform X2 [Pleurodeles waltl]